MIAFDFRLPTLPRWDVGPTSDFDGKMFEVRPIWPSTCKGNLAGKPDFFMIGAVLSTDQGWLARTGYSTAGAHYIGEHDSRPQVFETREAAAEALFARPAWEHLRVEMQRHAVQHELSLAEMRAGPRELSLAEVQAGAERAAARVDQWPQWKRDVEASAEEMYLRLVATVEALPARDTKWALQLALHALAQLAHEGGLVLTTLEGREEASRKLQAVLECEAPRQYSVLILEVENSLRICVAPRPRGLEAL